MGFEERFRDRFNPTGDEDFDADEALDFLERQVSAPMLSLTVSIQGQREPAIASNVPQEDVDAMETMADALDIVASVLRRQASRQLRAQLKAQDEEEALPEPVDVKEP